MNKYLACYDYGQGGLWWYILAPSEDAIHDAFRELTIFSSPPAFWNETYEKRTSTYQLGEPIPDNALAMLSKAAEGRRS